MSKPPRRVIFFDIRNTLGVVDRPGHLVKFRPTTDYLLKMVRDKIGVPIGVITNVPQGIDARRMLEDAGLLEYLDPNGIISTLDPDVLEVNGQKPGGAIYHAAAKRMGVPIEDCIYVGENLVEQLGAWAAGMAMGNKNFPPGGDFMREALTRGEVTSQSSGRLSEYLLEEDHLVGKRIVGCAFQIKAKLEEGVAVRELLAPIGRLVWLTNYFIDPYHHRKEEEALIPFALMRGIKPESLNWVRLEHEQGRAYFRAIELAATRVQDGDMNAVPELAALCGAFGNLYKEHGRKEDEQLFKQIGDALTDEDDPLLVGLIQRIGPPDLTLYIDMIAAMEKELGL